MQTYFSLTQSMFSFCHTIKMTYTQRLRFNNINNFYCFIKDPLRWNWLFSLLNVHTHTQKKRRIQSFLVQFGANTLTCAKKSVFHTPLLLNNSTNAKTVKKTSKSQYYCKDSFDLRVPERVSEIPRSIDHTLRTTVFYSKMPVPLK